MVIDRSASSNWFRDKDGQKSILTRGNAGSRDKEYLQMAPSRELLLLCIHEQ